MALAGTVLRRNKLGQGLRCEVQITASGNYVSGGDALSLASLCGYTNRLPTFVNIVGKAGFVYSWAGNGPESNRTSANQKMLVFVNTAGGVNTALGEHTAIAYVAGVTGDTIVAEVWFMGL